MLQKGAEWVKTTVRSHSPRASLPCLIEGQFSIEQDARQYPPGPLVGKIKSATEEAILDGEIENTYESAHAYFLKIKDEYVAGKEEG